MLARSSLPLVLGLVVAFSGIAAALTVNAPANVTLCTPTNITWQGGLPPFEVAISASGGYEQRYEDQFNHSFIWATALSDSEVVKVTITDKNGISAESPSFVAHTNPNVQCIGLAAPLSPTYGGAAASESAGASGSSAQALSTGAVAGIAVGAGVVGFGAIAALAAVCLRRRRSARDNRVQEVEDGPAQRPGSRMSVSSVYKEHMAENPFADFLPVSSPPKAVVA